MSALSDKLKDFGIIATARPGCDSERPPQMNDKMATWTVTLTYTHGKRRSMVTPFYTGSAITRVNVADVLSSLLTETVSFDNAKDYNDWCSEFGMDPDKGSNRKTWDMVCHQAAKVKEFLGSDYDTLKTLEH